MKILVIAHVWPEPCSSAAGGRTMELLRLFRGQDWQVSIASSAAFSVHRADLSALQIEEHAIKLNCDSFDLFLSAYQPEMVLFDRFFTEEQFGWRVEKQCPNALRVLDTCDLHSLREARHALLKLAQAQWTNERDRQRASAVTAEMPALYEQMATDDLTQREIAAIYRCDLSLMISAFEFELLQTHFGVPAYLMCENNLMLANIPNTIPSFRQRQHFISIGNFRHAPNWDAVLWLRYVIWPKIRAQLPQGQLHVYGAYPPPKAMQLHNPEQGFLVTGWVADAQQAMAGARVCLAPLRFGAGIKGKLADAMACGTPSVTTEIGSESMCGALPWGGAIANTADDLVSAAVDLYRDESSWNQAHRNAQNILQAKFNREQSQQALLAALQQARERQAPRRKANFTGLMLRHHSHKSTQYMSQWIALKNQSV